MYKSAVFKMDESKKNKKERIKRAYYLNKREEVELKCGCKILVRSKYILDISAAYMDICSEHRKSWGDEDKEYRENLVETREKVVAKWKAEFESNM